MSLGSFVVSESLFDLLADDSCCLVFAVDRFFFACCSYNCVCCSSVSVSSFVIAAVVAACFCSIISATSFAAAVALVACCCSSISVSSFAAAAVVVIVCFRSSYFWLKFIISSLDFLEVFWWVGTFAWHHSCKVSRENQLIPTRKHHRAHPHNRDPLGSGCTQEPQHRKRTHPRAHAREKRRRKDRKHVRSNLIPMPTVSKLGLCEGGGRFGRWGNSVSLSRVCGSKHLERPHQNVVHLLKWQQLIRNAHCLATPTSLATRSLKMNECVGPQIVVCKRVRTICSLPRRLLVWPNKWPPRQRCEGWGSKGTNRLSTRRTVPVHPERVWYDPTCVQQPVRRECPVHKQTKGVLDQLCWTLRRAHVAKKMAMVKGTSDRRQLLTLDLVALWSRKTFLKISFRRHLHDIGSVWTSCVLHVATSTTLQRTQRKSSEETYYDQVLCLLCGLACGVICPVRKFVITNENVSLAWQHQKPECTIVRIVCQSRTNARLSRHAV